MFSTSRLARLPAVRPHRTTLRRSASTQPPTPRPYKPTASAASRRSKAQDEVPAIEQEQEQPVAPDSEPRTGPLRYIWPFSKGIRVQEIEARVPAPPQDLARGQRATDRVVQTGELDARYKDAARRVTTIICLLPVAIYLTYVLYQRRFDRMEQKPLPRVNRQEELK